MQSEFYRNSKIRLRCFQNKYTAYIFFAREMTPGKWSHLFQEFCSASNSSLLALLIIFGALSTYCKLLLYFSADHAQKTIYGLLQAFSSSRFQASDQRKLLLNIKWQVSGEEGKQDATELAYTSASWLWN